VTAPPVTVRRAVDDILRAGNRQARSEYKNSTVLVISSGAPKAGLLGCSLPGFRAIVAEWRKTSAVVGCWTFGAPRGSLEVPMFWVIVAPLYFVLAAVAPSILGLFVNRARPNFRTLSLSLRAVFVVIALICLAATSYVHVDSDEIAVLNKIYGTSSLAGEHIIATNGEKGPQAEILTPGWHPWFLVNFIYQVQAPSFTDASIHSFIEALQEFHELMAVVLDSGTRAGKHGPMTHFNIPKLELLQHFSRSVTALGSPMQWTADITEHLHIINCKQPFQATNHRNFEDQCVRILDRLERMLNFDVYHLVHMHGLNTVSAIIRDANRVSDQDLPVEERVFDCPHPLWNLFLKGIVTSNAQVAFSLTKAPNLSNVSLTNAAEMYQLPDFIPALGDYLSGLSYQQRRGHRISPPSVVVAFGHINIWSKFRLQTRSFHQNDVITKPETVEACRPSLEYPLGKCDAVLINSSGGQVSAAECEPIAILFTP